MEYQHTMEIRISSKDVFIKRYIQRISISVVFKMKALYSMSHHERQWGLRYFAILPITYWSIQYTLRTKLWFIDISSLDVEWLWKYIDISRKNGRNYLKGIGRVKLPQEWVCAVYLYLIIDYSLMIIILIIYRKLYLKCIVRI